MAGDAFSDSLAEWTKSNGGHDYYASFRGKPPPQLVTVERRKSDPNRPSMRVPFADGEPLAPRAGKSKSGKGFVASVSDRISEAGGLGFSNETRQTVYSRYQNPLTTLTNGLWGLAENAYSGFQIVGGIVEELATRADEASRSSGLADALSFDGNKFLPGSAVMALGEAFPAGMEGLVTAPRGALTAARQALPKPKPIQLRPKIVQAVREAPAPVKRAPAEAVGPVRDAKTALPRTPETMEPEPGAFVTAEELLRDPDGALEVARTRIAALSDEDAAAWIERLAKAEEAGEVVDDPHYRSLLNIDLSDVTQNPERVLRAVEAHAEIRPMLLDHIATRKIETKTILEGVEGAMRRGLSQADLEERLARAQKGPEDEIVASQQMLLSGYSATKAYDRYQAALEANPAEARRVFQAELGDAVYSYAIARAIKSGHGRTLQAAQIRLKAGEDIPEPWHLPPQQIAKDFMDAFGEMDADDLRDHMARLRSGDDLGRVLDPLMDRLHARSVSMWRRTVGSLESAIKSNVLTPLTGIINAVGNVLHDGFRNGLSRRLVAAYHGYNGDELAALSMRLELDAANAAYWQAHVLGLRAMLDRIKFDLWEGVESTAGLISTRARSLASSSRKALDAANDFEPVRDNNSMNPAYRLRVNDVEGFEQKVSDLKASGAFGTLWGSLYQAGGVALNAADFASTISGKLFTGAVDDWGRAFVGFKEKHALAARSAVKEAIEARIHPDDIPAFVKQRTQELTDIPNTEMWERFEQDVLDQGNGSGLMRQWAEDRDAIKLEAQRITFQDGPQTELGKAAASFFQKIDPVGVIFRFVRTPIRLLERGMIDYTPAGLLADKGRAIISKGGPEAELYKAQMTIGTTTLALGGVLASMGIVRVTNGDWDSSENLSGAPSMRLQIGDRYIEFSRLDPFAVTVGLGALWGQAAREGFRDYEQYGDYEQATQAGIATAAFGMRDVVLSKSYMKNLRDFINLLTGGETTWEALSGSVASSLIPAAGTQRFANEALSGEAVQAVTVSENLYRSVVGVGLGLPARKNALGDDINARVLGIAAGDSAEGLDDIGRALQEYRLDISDVKRTDPSGIRLSASQLNRLREIRGYVATDAEGRTLRIAIGDLLASEEFQFMGSREARQALLNDTIRDFNKPARAILAEEDPTYAAHLGMIDMYESLIKEGAPVSEARETSEQTFEEYLQEGQP